MGGCAPGGHPTGAWDEQTQRTQTDVYGNALYISTVDADKRVVAAVAAVAAARGIPKAQVALAWVAQKAIVTAPIIGASKPQHLDDAVAALTLELTASELAQLEAPTSRTPSPGTPDAVGRPLCCAVFLT